MKLTNWIGIIPNYSLYIGFIYKITNLISGRIYFGKKFLFHPITKKESRWKTYKSSSKYVQNDIILLGEQNFKFEILEYHIDYKILHDTEIQLILDNWKSGNCYNKNVGGIILMDDEIKQKIQATFKLNGHPMKGRIHPNKGKHINSGHQLNKGKIAITNGIMNTFIPPDIKIPSGYYRGLTVNNSNRIYQKQLKIQNYLLDPKTCNQCNAILKYSCRNNMVCSKQCANKLHSITLKMTRINSGRNNPSWSGNQLHTPVGIFDTGNEAAKLLNVTAATIRNRCKNADKIIKKNYQIPEEYIGKTWRQVGYYFTRNSN